MAPLPRIKKIKPLANFHLAITWKDGGTDTVEMEGTISDFEPFRPLKDAGTFAQVEIVAYGRGIAWPNGLDFSADSLLFLVRQQRQEFTGEDFKAWQKTLGLSNAETANLLDVDISTVKNYRIRKRALPRIVRFACSGLSNDRPMMRAHYHPRHPGRPRSQEPDPLTEG